VARADKTEVIDTLRRDLFFHLENFSLERDHSLLERARDGAVLRKELEPGPVKLQAVGLGGFCRFGEPGDDFFFIRLDPIEGLERSPDETAHEIRSLGN